MPLEPFLQKLAERHDLSASEAQSAFDCIFSGDVTPGQIGKFLVDLHKKGETVEELLGAVISMRGKAITIEAAANTLDICGTGGDSHGTLNVSTAVAIVTAACGVPVAKHGNRAASSRSGSSDILTALGVNLEPDMAMLERCLKEINLCFLFAPRHHPAMHHVADVRRQLAQRTIFNLLGPLTNPANVRRHLIGVYDLEWLGPMAEVLKSLGSEIAWLVHGHDGMDEITTTAPTDVVELRGNMLKHFTLEPQQFGIPLTTLEDLKGSSPAENAEALKKLLAGARGPYRDIVLFNAAAALVVAGKAADMGKGLKLAAEAVDSDTAKRTLEMLVRLTNERPL